MFELRGHPKKKVFRLMSMLQQSKNINNNSDEEFVFDDDNNDDDLRLSYDFLSLGK